MSGIHRHILGRTAPLLLSVALQLASQRVAMSAPSLLFASTLGGNQSDTIRAIATDAMQNIYVVGETYSPDFPGPGTSSSARRTGDAFVVKLNSSGTQILYSVVLSGAGYDSARAVAVDSSGNAYVTGVTTSADFPVTTGAFQRSSMSPGLEDAFVVKLSPAGVLVYATYLGGSSSDLGYAIAIDPSGAAYVAGSTTGIRIDNRAWAMRENTMVYQNCRQWGSRATTAVQGSRTNRASRRCCTEDDGTDHQQADLPRRVTSPLSRDKPRCVEENDQPRKAAPGPKERPARIILRCTQESVAFSNRRMILKSTFVSNAR